jgi:glycosyltransferase involved in cell wall biosynthesis
MTLVDGRWPLAAPPAPPGARPGPRPTLSVIIAAYQSAAVVADAVGSALEQTLAAREVVVCDDGSTDDPAAALAPFGDRVTLLRQENRGEAGAKNAAARAASGEDRKSVV